MILTNDDALAERCRRLRNLWWHGGSSMQKHMLLLARSINFVDGARAGLIAREARNRRAMGGRLYLHQVKEVTFETLKRSGYREEIGAENVFAS